MKLVKVNEKIKTALNYAKINFPLDEYEDINIIKKACLKNSKDWKVPVEYQFLWYTLHRATIKRKIKDNKYIISHVNFFPIYIENSPEIIQIIKDAIKFCGSNRKFSKYVNRNESVISNWKCGRIKPPITAIMKASQILNLDFREIIINSKLYTSGSNEGESIMFDNKLWSSLCKISSIIKCEGHIEVSKPHIEIKQEPNGVDCLLEFRDLLKNIPQQVKIEKILYKNRKYLRIRVSSSVIRQLLCLFFDMELGYKCSNVSLTKDLFYNKNLEDRKYILAKCLELDGSFMKTKRINFASMSEQFLFDVSRLMGQFGYFPKFSKNFIVLNKSENIMKCIFDVLPYLRHKSRFKIINKWLFSDFFLNRLRIKNSNKLRKLVLDSRNEISKSNFKNYELANYLSSSINRKIVNHWLHGVNIPLIFVVKMCDLLNKNYFDYIPDYFSPILFAHKYIKIRDLEKIRGNNLSYLRSLPAFSNLIS